MKKIIFLLITIFILLISALNVFALTPGNIYDSPYWCTFEFGGEEYKIYIDDVTGTVRKTVAGSNEYLSFKDAKVLIYRKGSGDWYVECNTIGSGGYLNTGYYCDYTTFESNFTLYDDYTDGEVVYNPTANLILNPGDGHIYDTYLDILLDKNYIFPDTTYRITIKDAQTSRQIYETSFYSLGGLTQNFEVAATDYPQADGDYVITVTNFETGQVYDEHRYKLDGTKEIVKIVGIENGTYNYCPNFQVVHQSTSKHYLYFNNEMFVLYRKSGTATIYANEVDWQLGENTIEIRNYDDNRVVDTVTCNILRLDPDPEDDGLSNDNKPKRSDYEEGWLGDLKYGLDMLVYWITLPFVFLGQTIRYIADWLTSIIATVGNFSSQMGELFLFLPEELRVIIYTAIMVIILVSVIKAVR